MKNHLSYYATSGELLANANLNSFLGKRNWQLSLATGLYDLRCQPAGGPLAGCHIVFGQEEAAGVVPCRRSISL